MDLKLEKMEQVVEYLEQKILENHSPPEPSPPIEDPNPIPELPERSQEYEEISQPPMEPIPNKEIPQPPMEPVPNKEVQKESTGEDTIQKRNPSIEDGKMQLKRRSMPSEAKPK